MLEKNICKISQKKSKIFEKVQKIILHYVENVFEILGKYVKKKKRKKKRVKHLKRSKK